MDNLEDIQQVVLDPENDVEIIEQATERIRAASNNTITDFTPGSPALALVEGLTFVYSELLWYTNKLPLALCFELFKVMGVTRSPGTKARGTFNVLLKNSLTSDFVLPANYLIPYQGSGYTTTQTLVIPRGRLEGSVPVVALDEGSAFNIPEFSLSVTSTGLTGVSSIYNSTDITGGTDLEPLGATLERAQKAMRMRTVLVTQEDFEAKAEELLGYGSRAYCVPLLSSDKTAKKPGNAHVFVVGSNLSEVSRDTLTFIQYELNRKAPIGNTIWVSEAEVTEVRLDIVVNVQTLDPDIAKTIQSRLADFLSPLKYSIGATIPIKELEYITRSSTGVTSVVAATINGNSTNQPMSQSYSIPKLVSTVVTEVDRDGISQSYYL